MYIGVCLHALKLEVFKSSKSNTSDSGPREEIDSLLFFLHLLGMLVLKIYYYYSFLFIVYDCMYLFIFLVYFQIYEIFN